MAHHFKVDSIPHTNKDGSISKTRKDHFVRHTGRGGRWVTGPFGKKTEAQEHIEDQRRKLQDEHLEKHPNDRAYKTKHGIKS